MQIYRRFFKVTTGPLPALVCALQAVNDAAHEEYLKLLQEVGAKANYYHVDRRLTGFTFENEPDSSLWKRNPHGYGYWPKQTTKWGKDLAKRIRAIQTKSITSCLTCIGLDDAPLLFGNGKAWYATITILPYATPTVLISVPWYHEDPAVIENYIDARAKGIHMDRNLDHLLWKPTADMEALPEWGYKKCIHEWNVSVEGKS